MRFHVAAFATACLAGLALGLPLSEKEVDKRQYTVPSDQISPYSIQNDGPCDDCERSVSESVFEKRQIDPYTTPNDGVYSPGNYKRQYTVPTDQISPYSIQNDGPCDDCERSLNEKEVEKRQYTVPSDQISPYSIQNDGPCDEC